MKSKEELARDYAENAWQNILENIKVRRPHVATIVAASYSSGFDAGFQRAKEEFVGYLHKYREAYGEDICPPRRLEEFDGDVRTVVAFHMGRFLIDNMLRDVPEIGSELMPETSVPAEKPNATD